jgi:predicted ester cyclase
MGERGIVFIFRKDKIMSASKEQSAKLVRQFFEDVFTKGDRALAQEILAPDFVYYGPDEGIHGIDNFFHIVNTMRNTLKIQFIPEVVIAEDDKTAASLTTIIGAHEKDFRGFTPKGARFSLPRIDTFLIVDGKIKEVRAVFDHQLMFQILQEGRQEEHAQRVTPALARS